MKNLRKIKVFGLWGHLGTRWEPKGLQGGPKGAKESPRAPPGVPKEVKRRFIYSKTPDQPHNAADMLP